MYEHSRSDCPSNAEAEKYEIRSNLNHFVIEEDL